MSSESRILIISSDATDGELRSIIGKTSAIAKHTSTPFYLTVNGFDRDQRDLWNIPEARELLARACVFGVLSALEVGQPHLPPAPGLTALHVWLIVTGKIRADGSAAVDRDVFNQCYGAVMLSNEIADRIPPDDRDTFVVRA